MLFPKEALPVGVITSYVFTTRTLCHGFRYMWYHEEVNGDLMSTKRLPKYIECMFTPTFHSSRKFGIDVRSNKAGFSLARRRG